MSDETAIEQVGIEWVIRANEKENKKSEQSAENMIGLISDLAVIGAVAGEILGKMWDGVQKSIQASLKEFEDVNLALNVGIEPEDMKALHYAVGQIGGSKQDAQTMLGQMDKVIQSFRNPATGPEEIKKLFEDLAVYGVDPKLTEGIVDAIKSEDLIEALKLFADLRNDLGNEFSNFVTDRGLSSLANLESDFQYEDWLKAWQQASDRLVKIDVEGLNDLENGINKFKTALDNLTTAFGSVLGPGIDELGDWVLEASKTLSDWILGIKNNPFSKAWDESMERFNLSLDLIKGNISLKEYQEAIVKPNPYRNNSNDESSETPGMAKRDVNVSVVIENLKANNPEEFVEGLNAGLESELNASGVMLK